MNRTLGVVILGASTFPHFPPSRHLDNEAFARSASAFRHLLEDEQVSVFSSPVVLDLFDAEDDPTALIRRIKKFIQNEPALTDVLFYYCGHGDFLPDHHYYVTLKETEPENEAFTGLPVRQMRHALETQLALKRVFLVLDCCFSGSAAKEWMTTGLGHVIEEDVLRPFPRKGTALIAAAAGGEPAVAPEGERLTMFTGALIDIVSHGVASERRELSFRDVVDAVRSRISERYGCAGVAPVIHAPWQPQGDITSLPFFVNRAFGALLETEAEREIFEAAASDFDRPLPRMREAAAATLEDLLVSTQSASFRIEILNKLKQCHIHDDSRRVRVRCEEILAKWSEPSIEASGEGKDHANESVIARPFRGAVEEPRTSPSSAVKQAFLSPTPAVAHGEIIPLAPVAPYRLIAPPETQAAVPALDLRPATFVDEPKPEAEQVQNEPHDGRPERGSRVSAHLIGGTIALLFTLVGSFLYFDRQPARHDESLSKISPKENAPAAESQPALPAPTEAKTSRKPPVEKAAPSAVASPPATPSGKSTAEPAPYSSHPHSSKPASRPAGIIVPADPLQHRDIVFFATFDPMGERVVTASYDHTARIWNARTGAPIGQPLQHGDKVYSAAFDVEGKRIVTASADKKARIWDARTGAPLGKPLEHQGEVVSAAFDATGERIVTASADKTARIWDARSGAPIGRPLQHQGVVWLASFDPKSNLVVTASADKTARIWNARSGEPIGKPLQHEGAVWHAAFDKTGERVVTASADKSARIWDARTGAPVGEPLKHEATVFFATFDGAGKRVVTASVDKTARVWDVKTGKPLGAALEHESAVRMAVFDSTGARIVTASNDHTARIWDAESGKLAHEPLKHEGKIFSATFDHDGARVVTASQDKTARIWDVRSHD